MSENEIANKLSSLLAAFESKGAATISESMLPGLSPDQIKDACDWFPAEVPQVILDLYAWKNGQVNDVWNEKYPFLFRDMGLLSMDLAKSEYESMMQSYGVHNELQIDNIDLATAFPFAGFNGGWYVIPCSYHLFQTSNKFPVVCVLQGISMYHYSIENMLDFCVECVSSDKYSLEDGGLPTDDEQRIWEKHNPRIFEHMD